MDLPVDDFHVYQDDSIIPPENAAKPKKRRLHGACDACRKKKVKCDSAKMAGNICTNCRVSNVECTHNTPRQPKKSETQAIYIQVLEKKMEGMKELLHEAYPGQDIDQLLDGVLSNTTSENSTPDPPFLPSGSGHSGLIYPSLHSIPISKDPRGFEQAEVATNNNSDDDDLEHIDLGKQLNALSIDTVDHRFFGQSSAFMFFKHVAAVKKEATGKTAKSRQGPPSDLRRQPYWNMRPWELAFATSEEPRYIYPEGDLLESLVFIYFDKLNPFYPVLHQPIFRRLLRDGEHLHNSDFGMTVLLVCALASIYSNDPRVMMPGDTTNLSAGWRFFSQVPLHRNKLVYKSGLYDLQYFALALIYLHSTSIPNTACSLLGLGVQHALERGVHRRKPNSAKPTAEEELLKRAFWCLVLVDRYMNSFLGRPSIIKDEDFDLDYPIECDDEYWEPEDPSLEAFKQPPGKPSVMTGFVQGLKLCEMLAFTLRTLYSTKKSKVLSGLIGNEWEERIVTQLTTAMSLWKESLPSFLLWNPDEQNNIFFHQSAYLYATYYYVQILIHRPFLTKKSSLSFRALAICTNAARTCADMLEIAATRGIRITTPNIIVKPLHVLVGASDANIHIRLILYQMATILSGLVTVLNIWGNLQSQFDVDPEREKVVLQKCINVLKECERRSPMAGRFWQVVDNIDCVFNSTNHMISDLLGELAAFNQYQPSANKRPRVSAPVERTSLPVAYQQEQVERHSQQSLQRQYISPPLVEPVSQQSSPTPPNISTAPIVSNDMHFDARAIPTPVNWDLSNLLLIEMGYAPSFSETDYSQIAKGATHLYPTAHMGEPQQHTPYVDNNVSNAYNRSHTYVNPPNEEVLSLWYDIPAAFQSIREWDAYLASFGKI